MLAAKHFDPVIGIDIHLIQPPGPVPPVPIPHPFVGFLIDPADYVPFIGSTVQINGMHRAQAGTAGKCVPPHIPIGGVFVPPPPGNECEMFMGSATVEIDGEAQSYMSLPALSCQSVGMPSLPRITPKKKTIPKCLMLPTSQVLPIPAGPPVMIGGPPTISLKGLAMKAGMAALGKLAKAVRKLQRGTGRIGQAMRKLSQALRDKAKKLMQKLGIPPSVQNQVSRAICAVTGHPVDIATGKVFTEAVDFVLPGPIPLKFERVWFSTSVYDGPVGYGWHHSYDLALLEEDGAVAVRLADGRPLAFPALSIGESSFDRSERMTLSRDENGYRLSDGSGVSFRFGKTTFDQEIQQLIRVENSIGDRIEFHHDRRGHLELIVDSAGRKLPVETDSGGRITAVLGPHPDDARSMIRLVSFEYDRFGQLVTVMDALGQPMRFRYADRLLVQETDRTGLSFYFKYHQIGDQIRCHHTWGDNGIYDHHLSYDTTLRRTRVTNSLGHASTYVWNSAGLVTRVTDPLGNSTSTIYNESHQVLSFTDELQRTDLLEYDERGNAIVSVDSDSGRIETTYNERDLPVQVTDKLGNNWFWEYNEFGQLTSRTDPTGRTSKLVYREGRLAAIVDPAGNPSEFAYDSHGNVASVTSPNGRQTRWTYDVLGRPVRADLENGLQQVRKYDLLGRLIQVSEPDGNVRTFAYNPAGKVVYAKDVHREVRYTWQGMSRLASRRENGATVEFHYNSEEDLIAVTNQCGAVCRFELDERRKVVSETDFDSHRRIYTRDAVGRIIREERSSGVCLLLDYAPCGRISKINYSDGSVAEFHYRADGQLIGASNGDCQIEIERDAIGRILKEVQNGFHVSSEYSLLGLRSGWRTSSGFSQSIQRDVMGDVISLSLKKAEESGLETRWQNRIERNSMGLPIARRLHSDSVCRWHRDQAGRVIRQQLESGGADSRNSSYSWSPGPRLMSATQNSSTVQFEYSPAGFLIRGFGEDGPDVTRFADAIGNVYRDRKLADRRFSPGGQLLTARQGEESTEFRYDDDGNLIRKKTARGEWHYTWNAAGRLQKVVSPDGKITTFQYDPFGRRVQKSTESRVVHWRWDHNVVLHETELRPVSVSADSSGDQSGAEEILRTQTFVFHPESFVPLAVDSGKSVSDIISDERNVPVAVVDSAGHIRDLPPIDVNGHAGRSTENEAETEFRFPGQEYDQDLDLCYNRFRYYDPVTGVYLSADPLGIAGGKPSLYGYVSDTNTETDPFGLYNGEGVRDLGDYESLHDHKLSPSEYTNSDAYHFAQGNESLHNRMKADPAFAQAMEQRYPGVTAHVAPGGRGAFAPDAPPGLTWHHSSQPGVLELVDRADHRKYHTIYHPDGTGGRNKWGGGTSCR